MKNAIGIAAILLLVVVFFAFQFISNRISSKEEYVAGIDPLTEGIDNLADILTEEGFTITKKPDESALEAVKGNISLRYEWGKGLGNALVTMFRISIIYPSIEDFVALDFTYETAYYGFVQVQSKWLENLFAEEEIYRQTEEYRLWVLTERANNQIIVTATEMFDKSGA